MIEIGVSPIALRLGPLAVSWYGIMVVLALIAIVFVATREGKRYGISRDDIYAMSVWAILAGVIGARLVHIIDYWGYYSSNPLAMFGFEGFAVWGAILGAAVATGIYGWRKKISFWMLGDAVAPGAVLGQAIGRIGCTFNGCCYGAETYGPWAFMWTDPGTYAPQSTWVHPTQVYLLLWNLVVFGVLWILRGKLQPRGSLFLVYLAFYALGDFWIRFLRDGEMPVGGLLQAQVIALLIFAAALLLLGVRMARARAKVMREGEPKRMEPGPTG